MRVSTREAKYRSTPPRPENREGQAGVAVRPNEALVTVKGSKVHLRRQETYTVQAGDTLESISKKVNIPIEDLIKWNKLNRPTFRAPTPNDVLSITPPSEIFALCGGGSPNKEFPIGSVMFFEEGNYFPNNNPRWVVVTCYKCLKLRYMNLFKKEGMSDKIPERDFTPTDRRPEPSGEKIGLSKIIDMLKATPEKVRRAEIRGDRVVVFLTTKTGKRRDRVYGTTQSPKQILAVQNLLGQLKIPTRNVETADPSIYERRRKHIMIPFGRFGAFGGNNTLGKGKNKKTTAQIVTSAAYSISDNKFFTPTGEISVKWVQEYFLKNKAKLIGGWRVGSAKARTQQWERDDLQTFTLAAFDLLNLKGYKELKAKDAERAKRLVDLMIEFGNYLYSLPASQILGLNFKSHNAQFIRQLVIQKKRSERAQRNPPERVPQLLENIHKFDTMLSELEGANAQSRRSSLRKR